MLVCEFERLNFHSPGGFIGKSDESARMCG
jgi:hypothetical protein